MKKIFLTLLILAILFLCYRMVVSWKADNEIITRNENVSEQLNNLKLKSIFLYKRRLYSKYNNFKDIKDNEKLSMQYDIANYDIDLMPIIISKSVILCQTHSLKILNDDLLYEYKCDEQILSITYPEEENNNLNFYVIKLDSTKNINKVPETERQWLLQKIIFNEGEFIEETLSVLDLPVTCYIKQLKSEISFFARLNDFFYVVLTNNNNETAIYQFSHDGKMLKKIYSGYIIIPNRFSVSDLWYIQKGDNENNYLIKNDSAIVELNKNITQGRFINDSTIEFFYYDTSGVGIFDFINGTYAPFYFSNIYLLDENRFIDGYFKEVSKKFFIFNDKVRRDNILVVF